MTIKESYELRNKILRGLELTIERLLIQKKKENKKIALSKNGQVVIVDACDIKNIKTGTL